MQSLQRVMGTIEVGIAASTGTTLLVQHLRLWVELDGCSGSPSADLRMNTEIHDVTPPWNVN